jgi:coenzyme F420 biosynthesis associated uncharacterized protein
VGLPAGHFADWGLAERVAWTISSSGPLAPTTRPSASDVALLRADLERTAREADRLARAATGLGEDLPPAEIHVLGRRAWVRSNLESLAHLTAPVADRLMRRGGLSRAVTKRVMAVQLGVVFGFLSTRVLGQYEVIRPPGPDGAPPPGRLVLVGPNLLELEATLLPEAGVSAGEFRMGVVLHEMAHRLQFEGVPWLGARLEGLLAEYIDEIDLDPDRLRELARRVVELRRDPVRLLEPASLLELVLTPRQAEVVREAQALMSLLEGHGNVVMDWGAEVAAREGGPAVDPSRVRDVLNRRRGKGVNKAVSRVLGLSMKAEQYRTGERFILAVAERYGRDVFDRVWEDRANVPTQEELTDADAWVARVAPGAVDRTPESQ